MVTDKVAMKEYQKKYREANKEKLKEQKKIYDEKNSVIAVERVKQWRINNQEQYKQNNHNRYQENKKTHLTQCSERYFKNSEPAKARTKQWKKDNPDRVLANNAKRRAQKRQAIPSWVEWDEINILYKECITLTEDTNIKHQVDHIIPLNSKTVCGLHCKDNIQILTATENNKKKCKFQTDW